MCRNMSFIVMLCLSPFLFQVETKADINLARSPLYISGEVPPLVMLNVSKDHQLFYKAYNDFSDLDADSIIDTTYKHSISYYGYFDPNKCYSYNSGGGYFVPETISANKYCNGQWSGNFLNWVSMSRMDAVRKLLFGGKRSIDTSTLTVLERNYLPTDAHSWAKYYNGSDIAQLTPFNPSITPPTDTSTSSVSFPSSYPLKDGGSSSDPTYYQTVIFAVSTPANFDVGDQIQVVLSTNSSKYMIGGLRSKSGSNLTLQIEAGGNFGTGGPFNSWRITNLSKTGISFCNTTIGSSSGDNQYSQTNTNPPLIRVAKGNYALWSANEKKQCKWSAENSNLQSGFYGGFRSNGNRAAISGINASSENPSQTAHGLGSGSAQGEFIVRVQACKSAVLIGTESCKLYPDGNYKPIGLLQIYGDTELLKFGLFTGSYNKNISGGVLRKNTGNLKDEINIDTNGTFIPSAGGIINNLSKLRIYGYNYAVDDNYGSGDGCTYQRTGFVVSGATGTQVNQGNCTSWGNPMSEIYLESLRYLAGKTPTSAFTYTTGNKDAALGLTVVSSANWKDPLSNDNYCAPLNILNFNASVSSYDTDQMTGASDIGSNAINDTNFVGDEEGISELPWFIGSNGTIDDSLCSAKTVSSLGAVLGLCPEAPTMKGGYQMAGVAYHAHTNKIRSDLTVPSNDNQSLKVSTYGIALATNVPKIDIPVPGSTSNQKITILPAYRLDRSSNGSGPFGGGTLVDFKIVCQITSDATSDTINSVRSQSNGLCDAAGTGAFYANWEDSEQGGDYDQDMWGVIKYRISSNSISVTTDAVSASTSNGQGFGYVISGTDKDGPHFHSGIYNFDYTDPVPVTVRNTNGTVLNGSGEINTSGGCTNCVVSDPATVVTYDIGQSTAGVLKDPLWYAAKWGGFKEDRNDSQNPPNNLPDLAREWDSKKADGTAGSDGIPDNYFYVVNPSDLENSLNKAFIQILESSSASSVATNSTSLQSGSRIYQAQFNSRLWSGKLLSFKIDSTTGRIITPEEWDAGVDLTKQLPSNRQIITYNRDKIEISTAPRGIPFTWSAINGLTDTTQKDELNTNSLGANDGLGEQRLNYLRGSKNNEGSSATNFRQRYPVDRSGAFLGDIINSNPWYVGVPQAGYPGSGYLNFRTSYLNRKPVIYVGANDGMLHGFDASVDADDKPIANVTGKEIIAYVPGRVYEHLSKLTEQDYNHRYYVDGSPMVADADVNGWKTILVGGLNAGGQGYYALDITNPANFSESNAGNIVLWEFTDEDDPDLGYTFNQPRRFNDQIPDAAQIRKMANGRWAVIVGNGYNNTEEDDSGACADDDEATPCTFSTTGHAVLYILFLDGGLDGQWSIGTDFIKIELDKDNHLDTEDGYRLSPSGLSTPFVVDADGDDDVDFIYAGDLRGNLWKFDVTSSDSDDWGIALAGNPLFTAKDAGGINLQPITSAPTVTPHPNGGFMVSFGTGKYLENSDVDPDPALTPPFRTQTLYGLWDKTGDQARSIANRATLVEQTVVKTETVGTVSYRIISQNPVTWIDDQTTVGNEAKDGWYLDLPNSSTTGERLAYNPLLRFGRFIATTLIPSSTPCESGGKSWVMELDYLTGGRLDSSPFDVDGDGQINDLDLRTVTVDDKEVPAAVGGLLLDVGIAPTPTVIDGGESLPGGTPPELQEFKIFSGSTGAIQSVKESVPPGRRGRINWREITE